MLCHKQEKNENKCHFSLIPSITSEVFPKPSEAGHHFLLLCSYEGHRLLWCHPYYYLEWEMSGLCYTPLTHH